MVDDSVIEKYRQAGAILSEVRKEAALMVKKDVRILDVAEAIEANIVRKGGKPAFPVNISMNEAAAHDTAAPDDERVFGEDMVKLDIGVHIDGYIADTAITIDLSGNPDIVKASEAALEEAIKVVKAGVSTEVIGEIIEETITGYGMKPITNLTGHGLDRYVQHAPPPIPNKKISQGHILTAGQVIAIEPFATNGLGLVMEGQSAEIFGVSRVKPVRMPAERDLLKSIEKFQGLPFARRWLSDIKRLDTTLYSLMRQGIIHSYPVLIEHDKGLVSQAEHTMIVTEDGCEVTTR
ncbi:type II methionyl aminopeptidase [Methanocella sp. CWC-04]|uniref:Methionine aminopeptidase n=1 Tax=Methanooceanicella nereidis TaxID=2052831 RepID=A0AAP2W6A9_9EURY|nr:type II methionyl aminopeptidase [Methanocella sp. CWC-04]MCD1295153.1 type II methionyl aminopeptidase [Methanocella sp. CWC-04]